MDLGLIDGALAWFLPGVGHLKQKRWKRGLAIALTIWSMYIIGILSGGAYFPGFGFKDGALLYLLHAFASIGNGLGYFLTMIFSAEPNSKVAAWSTFEYGGKFLEAAGLLNFLAVLDAFDISIGRKK